MTTLLGNELARRINSRLELRPQPLRVRWNLDELVTADRHEARCTFECSVRALSDPTERRMLQEVLLNGKRTLTADDIAAHFRHCLRSALRHALASMLVETATSEAGRASLVEAMKAAAHPVAFSCGLELLPPFHLELESPSFQQQRLREMQRELAERHAADQVQHLQRAGELLKQFQSIRASAPELSAGQVLQQISPTDRGSVLQALLLASAGQDRASDLWAVSGPYLVRIDARQTPPTTQLTPLPPTLGPLRSIKPATIDGERVLLVGARSGFMLVRPQSAAEPAVYHDPQTSSQLGFSRVVHWAEQNGFAGCHGEAGIVRWNAGETAEPRTRVTCEHLREQFPDAGRSATPRNLQVLSGDRLVFSFGSALVGLDAGDKAFAILSASRSEIVTLLSADRDLIAIHEDGEICAIRQDTLEITCRQRTGTRVAVAGALPWLGSTRVLLGAEHGPVQSVGLDDPLVTHYASSHHGLRGLAGSADRVAAISADRQRLILWPTWDGRHPAAEIYLTPATQHRIADVDFA